MGQINLYKIDSTKQELFFKELKESYTKSNKELEIKGSKGRKYNFSLYTYTSKKDVDVEWQWVLNAFGEKNQKNRINPKSVIVIKRKTEIFSCSFGFSFFLVDKFCDTDFAFNFARKAKFNDIKITALNAPTSKRNKYINSYINFSEFEFQSGEAFSKIKGKIEVEESDILKPIIEVGHSIKFSIEDDSLKSIIVLIETVDSFLEKNDISHIPTFNKVVDKNLIKQLEMNLVKALEQELPTLHFSEIDIIGTNAIFNKSDCDYILKYRKTERKVSDLSINLLIQFCKEIEIPVYDALRKVKIRPQFINEEERDPVKLIEIFDFIDDDLRCVLLSGKWYQFNDDYLSYLKKSINEIEVEYNAAYNFKKEDYEDFINKKYRDEVSNEDKKNLSEAQHKRDLNKSYYAEYAFNNMRCDNDGFELFDRTFVTIGKSKIEVMDLYKDNSMFAVKIGNTSSQLCYVIDQSLAALKLLQHKKVELERSIKNIVIWLVLERERELKLNEKKQPDINALNMLLLKNKIDDWKRQVRLAGYTPKIYINYRKKVRKTLRE